MDAINIYYGVILFWFANITRNLTSNFYYFVLKAMNKELQL